MENSIPDRKTKGSYSQELHYLHVVAATFTGWQRGPIDFSMVATTR
jgi:hypothetical protein